MNSYIPIWLTDLAAIVSIISFIVTCFLLVEARKIRDSFLKKVRIPETVNDLERIAKDMLSDLSAYVNNSRSVPEKVTKSIALLESISQRLSQHDVTKINSFVKDAREKMLAPSEDNFWAIYAELSGVIAYLQQLAKDTRLN